MTQRVQESIEVQAPLQEVFTYWSNLEHFPEIMSNVEGEVDTSGEVRFEEIDSDRTRIEVTMNYTDPPGGRVGEVVADAISNPERMMREDLENFAARVERGEVE